MDGTSSALWPALISALLSLLVGGGGVAWYTARESRAARVSGQEHTARRDEVEDREWLIEHYQQRAEKAEARVDELEELRRRDADYVAQLRDHIYRGAAPPPPARPTP